MVTGAASRTSSELPGKVYEWGVGQHRKASTILTSNREPVEWLC
jgi:hypothetical protein